MADREGHAARLLGREFSVNVLAVLFALTFGKALEVAFGGLAHYETVSQLWVAVQRDPLVYLLLFLQLAAFFATLFRFYAGSYRFHEEPSGYSESVGVLVDWAGTALLFVGFFVAATVVKTTGLFLMVVAIFHIFDMIWLLTTQQWMKNVPHVQKVINNYLVYDLITLGAAALAGCVYAIRPFDSLNFYWINSGILISMFFIDIFWCTRDWYFNAEKWREAQHG